MGICFQRGSKTNSRKWVLIGLLLSLSLPVAGGDKRHLRYFPMIALNKDAATIFMLHNPAGKSISVAILLRDPDGSELISEEVTVGPWKTRRLEYQGDSAKKAVGGWAELRSSQLFYVSELLRAGPSPLLGVPEGMLSRRFKIFGMVALRDGLQTGLALTNPHPDKTAGIQLVLRNMDGIEVRRTTLKLLPLSNTSG